LVGIRHGTLHFHGLMSFNNWAGPTLKNAQSSSVLSSIKLRIFTYERIINVFSILKICK